ncbi:hypothetical protein N9D67_01140 [Gammaproteobacteria bacterium]|jgi:transcriptional antiterminator RfaH|nr:hypothetical protein [Gammaproteobacteria bacterium]
MNTAQKGWLVVRYKINEKLRFERNLLNQNFEFYIPKVFTNTQKNGNQKAGKRAEVLFPGYGFVQLAKLNIHALKYTFGIRDIIRFGDQYAIAQNSMIIQLKELECSSKNQPISLKHLAKDDIVTITSGPFRGYISKILASPLKDRATILISLLGSDRTLTIPVQHLEK